MDYKITRKEKNSPIQGTDECDKKYYISFFLEHNFGISTMPYLQAMVLLVMAAALWLMVVGSVIGDGGRQWRR